MKLKHFGYLLHEQWRSTYKLFAIAVAICLASCLGPYVFLLRSATTARYDYRTVSSISIAGLHIGHLLWISFLLFASGDDDDLRLSMPRFLMRLPVSAWKLVAARMSYGLLSTLALAFAGTIAYHGLFDGRTERELPFRTLLIIYPTSFAMLQSAVWCIGPAGIVPTIAVIAFGSLIPNGIFFDFRFSPFDPRDYSLPGVGAAIMISFLTAGVVIEQHRKGRFAFLESFPAFVLRLRSSSDYDSITFSSKEDALRWYEHRRQWRLFPPILLTLFLAFLVVRLLWYPWVSASALAQVPLRHVLAYYAEWVLFALYSALIAATALTGGLFIFRSGRPLLTKDRMFLFVRPISVKTLTATRWDSGARTIAFSLLPLFAVAIFMSFVDLRPGPFDPATGEPEWGSVFAHLAKRYPVYLVALMTIAGFASIYAAVWAVLWFENVLAIGAVFAIVAFTIENLPAFQEMDRVLRSNYELRITAVVVLAVLIPAAVVALRRGLVSSKHLLILLGVAPILGIGLFLVLNETQLREKRPLDTAIWTTMVPLYLLAVIAPLVTTPLVTQWARHRR